ncbi:MAG: aldose 1-epimerase family protein [Planctomycetota bacterium]
MSTQAHPLRSVSQRIQSVVWDETSPLTRTMETREGPLMTRHGRFVGGQSDGVEVIEVDTGAVRFWILPSRGMSIWRLEKAGHTFGWRSPVAGPIHPDRVPVLDPGGLGWLEGFDELLVRCGLESNGAPQFSSDGQLLYPLHGRIANLAADSLSIEYDEASGRLEVIAEIIEAKLFFKRLRLRSRVRVRAGQSEIELLDDVSNDLAKPAAMQLLYHINVGPPVLGEGASVEVPLQELAPKDDLSAGEIESWNQFGPPEESYSERVYFATLRADESNLTTALLKSKDSDLGLAVGFSVKGLPRFVLWKNTAAESDGYVVGLEPATNYPNTRGFEEQQGRVVTIPAGETVSFRVSIDPLTDEDAVQAVSQTIKRMQGDDPPTVHESPKNGW